MTDPLQAFPFLTTLAQGAPEFSEGATRSTSPGVSDGTASESQDGSADDLVGGGGGNPQSSPFGNTFVLIMLAFIAFLFISSIFAGRKQKKMRAQMIGSLAKHDRVMTTSGMIGTIVELKDKEMVLRVDDATGAKIHFNRDAVAHVLKPAND